MRFLLKYTRGNEILCAILVIRAFFPAALAVAAAIPVTGILGTITAAVAIAAATTVFGISGTRDVNSFAETATVTFG